MKGSDQLKETIKSYLDNRAATDELFAASYKKDNKNIDDCINYILNTVKASGCSGFADSEIFSMAVHYYDEDNIKVGKPISARVVVNHVVELSEDEKQRAKDDAYQKLVEENKRKILPNKSDKKAKSKPATETPSLFDL